ncbi:MAG: hypothetical protein M0005_04820 [Actinomycetota bacterium]|jgi:hypothetical protein|nr:hypothetical protein [Actinomycetota bacterium]
MNAGPGVRPALGWSWPAGAGLARGELRLSQLASLPSPGELEALHLAVQAVLGMPVPQDAGGGPWRMAGRWWRPAPWQAAGAWRVGTPKVGG